MIIRSFRLRSSHFALRPLQRTPIRTLVAAPRPGSGPLLERRADRELPDISSSSSHAWLRTMPIFLAIIGISSLAIFNYQKSSSPVVSSTLYALRTSPKARELLGDEIYFAAKIPLIRGQLNQMHGKIDLRYWVKGTKGKGLMRFKSVRPTRMGYFQTQEWSLEMPDGKTVQLLDTDGPDPFNASMNKEEA
ncbi:MAG: hypothetical protein M1834_004466 [Cirrosporium novae-zelandiae]|nr:MAG: hypothetical protein M1834_004466 [Cirrosporium novae-zelandiae]